MKSVLRVSSICLALLLSVFSVLSWAGDFTVYSGQLPPINYQDESDKAKGIAIDVLAAILKDLGQPIDEEKVRFIDWPKAIKTVESTPHTILVSAALTPEREYKFKWVGPVSSLKLGLIANKKNNIRIHNRSDVSNYRVALIRGSAPIAMLEAGYGMSEKDMILVDTDDEQFELMKNGEVDCITHTDMSTPSFLNRYGMSPSDYEMVHVLTSINLYILMNKDTDSAFVSQMQSTLEDMKRSRFDEIVSRYLGDGPIQMHQ